MIKIRQIKKRKQITLYLFQTKLKTQRTVKLKLKNVFITVLLIFKTYKFSKFTVFFIQKADNIYFFLRTSFLNNNMLLFTSSKYV